MAVTAFKLPSKTVNEDEAPAKSKFTPIDTTQLPTKDMTETFAALVAINAERKKIEDALEEMLAPYFDPPEGLVTVFGFRYNSIAFNFVPPRETKGKMVLKALPPKTAKK